MTDRRGRRKRGEENNRTKEIVMEKCDGDDMDPILQNSSDT
jgi:hypothetical protein